MTRRVLLEPGQDPCRHEPAERETDTNRPIITMNCLLQDLRFAVRTLAKNRGLVAVVVLTLTLGMAGNIVVAGLMVGVSALLGALPVIRCALRADLHSALQSSAQQSTPAGGGRRRLQVLVVAEVALTLVLVVEAGLLLQAFRALQRADPGYRPDHVLVCEIALPETQYNSKESRLTFYQSYLEPVRTLPGVVSASAVSAPPLGGHWGNFFTIEGAPPQGPNEPDPVVLQRIALPGYFETMGISLVAGRSFTDQDGINDGSRAVVVNETFAKRFWSSQDPVGRRISHRYPKAPWMTVIGVARDVKHYGVDRPMIPGVYLPFVQDSPSQMSVVVRRLGLTGAVIVALVTRSLLYGISPLDPYTLGGVPVLLTAVALLACWVPARRAAKVDPMVALRTE